MGVELRINNESSRKRMYRRDVLARLVDRILGGESVEGETELSILFCDDPFIRKLNRDYCKKNRSTDVLSFEQAGIEGQAQRVLGDVVISLETVESNCGCDPTLMRDEVKMLVCHGVLHLLGYDHGTTSEKKAMVDKQASYLGVSSIEAWGFGVKSTPSVSKRRGEAFSGGR